VRTNGPFLRTAAPGLRNSGPFGRTSGAVLRTYVTALHTVSGKIRPPWLTVRSEFAPCRSYGGGSIQINTFGLKGRPLSLGAEIIGSIIAAGALALKAAGCAARADAAGGGTRAEAAGEGRYSQARRRAAETGYAGALAVSMGQDPRGFVRGPSRPDYARPDDIQSRRRAKSRKFVRASIDRRARGLIPARAGAYSLRYRGRAA
jgi:hypothetical protein